MPSDIKIYKVQDFVRVTETGELDHDRSIQIVRQLATAAGYHVDHNILLDMRETTVKVDGMADLLRIALEFAHHKSVFRNKVANVIPDEPERMALAEQFKACLTIEGFDYEVFTDFEQAIEWLSETEALGQPSG